MDNHRRGPTVKTTIVGGQPPGNERGAGDIPAGLEQLLSMAAVDPEFAEALRERPEEAIRASGLQLTPSEQAILRSVGPGDLGAMIDGVRGVLPDEERRKFLGRSAAAMLVLLGGVGGASACDTWGTKVTGSRPEPPPPHSYPAPTGARPDPPEPPPDPPKPPPKPPKPPAPPKPDQGVPRPSPTRGTRPDPPKPPPKSRGISPDRPGRKLKDPFKD